MLVYVIEKVLVCPPMIYTLVISSSNMSIIVSICHWWTCLFLEIC